MIKLLTTSIHQKISGGTIYNSQLLAFLQQQQLSVELEMISNLNEYPFQSNTTYLIDGILLEPEFEVKKMDGFSIIFLIHLWPSKNPALTEDTRQKLQLVESTVSQAFTVVVTGQSSFNYWATRFKHSQNNTYLLSPGIKENWLKKMAYAQKPKKFVYLANFIEGKGHDTLVEIVAQLESQQIQVDCYGEILSDSYFRNFKRLLDTFKCTNIHYQGVVDYNEVNTLLLQYDMLLSFSEYESFGMSVMEALASGIPVLMTPTGNYAYYQDLGIKGILQNFEKDEALIEFKKLTTSDAYYQAYIDSLATFEGTIWAKSFEPLLSLLQS